MPLTADCLFGVQTFLHHHCEFWKADKSNQSSTDYTDYTDEGKEKAKGQSVRKRRARGIKNRADAPGEEYGLCVYGRAYCQ
jgi:hypothetical protein